MVRFRCLKYWLKGEFEGKTEVFIDNLPGGPDNINLLEDGSYWIALLKVRTTNKLLYIHTHWNGIQSEFQTFVLELGFECTQQNYRHGIRHVQCRTN